MRPFLVKWDSPLEFIAEAVGAAIATVGIPVLFLFIAWAVQP